MPLLKKYDTDKTTFNVHIFINNVFLIFDYYMSSLKMMKTLYKHICL